MTKEEEPDQHGSEVDRLSVIGRDHKGREYMRWPREGESMGAYREYIKRLLVDYGEVVPAEQLQGAVEDYERCQRLLDEAEADVERWKDQAQTLRRALDACQFRQEGQ